MEGAALLCVHTQADEGIQTSHGLTCHGIQTSVLWCFAFSLHHPTQKYTVPKGRKVNNTKVSLYRSQVSAGQKECHGWLEGWRWPREGTRSKWNSCKKCKAQTDSHSRERRPVGREEVGTTCVLGLGLTVTSPCWQQCPFCSVTWHAKWNYTWLRRKREFIGSSNWS